MKCTSCQTEIESGLVYCPKCGKPVQLVPNYNELEEELLSKLVEDKDATDKDKFATGVYKPVDVVKPEKTTEDNPSTKSADKPRIKINKFIPFIVLLIIVFIAIGIYAYKYVTHVNSFDYLISHAKELEDKQSYTNAADYYKKAAELDQTSFDAIFGLGKMYFYANEYKSSIDALKGALELDSENTTVYEYLVQAYLALDDKQSIYELYNSAINENIRNSIAQYIVTPPEFSIQEGTYNEVIEVEITTNQDYDIFYTTDGKDPTKYGKLYKEPVIFEQGEHTLKAVCMNSERQYSYICSVKYTINIDIPPLPVVSNPEGNYTYPLCLTVSVPEGYACFYTTDGSKPTAASTQYLDLIVMPYGTSNLSVVYMSSSGVFGPIYTGTYNCVLEGQ